jgi:phage-related protein
MAKKMKSNFIVRGGFDGSAISKGLKSTQKQLATFQQNIGKTIKRIASTVAIGKLIKDSVQSAMGVESSMAQLARTMGDSAGVFDDWAKTQANAFGMAREEAYQYGATFSNLISTFASGTEETTKLTTDLLKASAVVASSTGRTMEDTMDRIRSGLLGSTEAIEDLGINVNVAMLESTKAFKQFANGRSWQKLSFQEQQQIRLMAILEQATEKYGDSLAGTTATKQMSFLATLKNIRLNLGQAFLPIYNIVLPAITSLANKIENITAVLAQFSQALFGSSANVKNTQKQTQAVTRLGDAVEEAGDKAKGSVAGFDEIHNLDLSDATNIPNVAEQAVTPVVATVEQENAAGGLIDTISEKAQEAANKVRETFNKLKDTIVENKNIIVPALGAIAGALTTLAIAQGIQVAIDALNKLKLAASGAWKVLSANPVLAIIAVIGALVSAFITAYKTNDEFRVKVDSLWATIKTKLEPAITTIGNALTWVWENVIKPLGTYLAGVFVNQWQKLIDIINWLWNNVLVPVGDFLLWLWEKVLYPVGSVIVDVLVVAFRMLSDVAEYVWHYAIKPLSDFLSTVFTKTVEGVAEILQHLWNNILVPIAKFLDKTFRPVIEFLANAFVYLWQDVLKPIVNFLWQSFKPAFEDIFTGIRLIINGLKHTFEGLIDFIVGVFTGNWQKAWEGVKNIFGGIFDSLYGLVRVPLNAIIRAVNWVIEGLNKIKIDVPQWVQDLTGIKGTIGFNIAKLPELEEKLSLSTISQTVTEVVRQSDISLADEIASATGTAVLQALQLQGTANQSQEVVLNVDGRELGRVALPLIQTESSRLGYRLVLETQ